MIERHVLMVKQLLKAELVDEGCFATDIEFERYLNHAAHATVLQFKLKCATELRDTADVRYTRDWWEHFKMRWFPQWYLKKYPVKLIHQHFEMLAWYPDIVIPDHKTFVEIICYKNEESHS